mmetsp:Transcript_45375/g.108265  ORF Transcript_45375/g.108265 Transcript_45375/m.108265 type:complete len:150 (-) Transcript_45375:31-480(-)
MRAAVLCALGFAASASAFAPAMSPLTVSPACAKTALPLRPMALRSGARTTTPKMVDASILPGVAAGVGGLTVSIGLLWWTEQRAVSSISKIGEDQMTKLQAKMDGGEAENKFNGSDQNLDTLISTMESGLGVKSEKKATKAVVEEDDGW